MSVLATEIGSLDDDRVTYRGDRLHGPPGAMFRVSRADGIAGFWIACPRCGAFGSARHGHSWEIEGDPSDVTTLTLTPSIRKACCDWHGFLVNGQFVPVKESV